MGCSEMKCSFRPYEGNDNYIFVSYSHSDSGVIAPILESLNRAGFRIWYDEGIEWGDEWPESVARHLHDCEVCLAFHSRASVVSENCRQEIHYALKKKKRILSVFLERTELSEGLDMQLSPYQSTFLYQYDDEEEFFSELANNKILQSCRSEGGSDSRKAHSDDNVNLDLKLKEKFAELFYNSRGIKKPELSPLAQKITEVKQRKFMDSLSETADKDEDNKKSRPEIIFNDSLSLVPVEFRVEYSNGRPKSWEGRNFSIKDVPGFKTIVFHIVENVDYKTLTKYNTCELLESRREYSEEGSSSKTRYYIDFPQEDGDKLVILSFNKEEGEAYVNTGIIKDEFLKVSRKPQYLHWGKKAPDTCDGLYLNGSAYNLDPLPEGKGIQDKKNSDTDSDWINLYDADIDKIPVIIIDPETALPVTREIYYDEASGRWRAKIKTTKNKTYFAFQISFKENGSESGPVTQKLSDFEIAQYYKEGLYGFPKDAVKAMTYFEKDGTAQSLYEIAVLFRTEESLQDQDLYLDYLHQAIDKGCGQAVIESALGLIRTAVPEKQEQGIKLLEEVGEEVPLKNFMLGYLTENGYNKESSRDAFEFYFRAAAGGYKPACARLGIRVSEFHRFQENELQEIFMANLYRGYEISRYCLGCILFYGLGILPQEQEGISLLEKSAEKGYKMATKALELIFDGKR